MPIDVRPARSKREIDRFLELPYALHAGDPIWTPPLKEDLARSLSDENPLFQEGRGEREMLVAWEGSRPVGRVLAHVHHAQNRLHGERAGFFGLLECPDDLGIAKALLDAAAEHHRSRGLTELRGPYELTITQCIGAVTAGFDEPPSTSQSWNAPHVPRLLEALGFEVVYRATAFRMDDVAGFDPEAMLGDKHRAWLKDPAVRMRGWDMDRFDDDIRAAMTLLNDSFTQNFGFVPLSDPEVAFFAGPMKRVVRPELTVFMELAGEPVGVAMAIPDFNVIIRRMEGRLWPFGWAKFLAGGKHIDAAVFQFIATSPAHQNKGLIRIVIAELMRRLQHAGFRTLDGTWIGDVNVKSQAQTRALGMREKHRLALYRKALAPGPTPA
jgi:GNAT superfamily N-acetyltransferase